MATMNKAGFVRVKAVKVGDDTTFSQIIRLVEDASSSKAPIAKIAGRRGETAPSPPVYFGVFRA